ncbi:hypothetical protein Cgig2_016165 [Carnegiea gigantea]|uniref:Hydroxyproline O-arabinosyltransferase-like domain-containing protein n=1 Tax=Carnegiea gigantea TaxID=171969 RepID=A0A9Q1KNF5_9CARY|nr:hypothetical protein Cgig2_016165 [Carnegiea gigantea]
MRKMSIGRGSLCLFAAVIIGFPFATYNFTTFWIRYQDPGLVKSVPHGSGRVNPKFHVAVTASDAPYSKWQCRIMYYWYKRSKDRAGSEMGGFTRVLHSGRPDNLMEEIPTFVVDPLPNGVDQGYVVLNRPWAFLQWLEKAKIEEEYVLMGEPDHIFVKPLPNLAHGKHPAAYPFFYIKPAENEKILRRYAYAVASALHGVKHTLHKEFMVQPPWESKVGKSYIIHYTYGCDYTMKGELTYGKIGEWRFDKRQYLNRPPPKNLTLPPPGVPESVVRLVKMINEATANIPRWEDI